MLNEERVRHMVKLATYEARHGEEEIKISTIQKKDYVKMQVFISCIWVTCGYAMLLFLLGVTVAQPLMAQLTMSKALIGLGIVFLIYIFLLLRYTAFAWNYYTKKYIEAKNHVNQYLHDLETLERMYEEDA